MTYLTQGIILRRGDLGDYDRQYAIYTRDKGKVIAVAKGAKKISSKLNSHLDFFSVSDLMLANGSTGVERIAGVKLKNTFKTIGADVRKAAAAFYFLEATDKMTVISAKDPVLFELLGKFLSHLSENSGLPWLLLLNKYLFELLKHLGYQPKITAASQKQLLNDFNRLIEVVAEKKLKSFNLVSQLI